MSEPSTPTSHTHARPDGTSGSDAVSHGDVQKLAALARIQVSDKDLPQFAEEFGHILAYVGQLEQLSVSGAPDKSPAVRNVLREDGEPHEGGVYTEKLAAPFPDRDGDYLKVKQIISHD